MALNITISNRVKADIDIAAALFFETCGLDAARVTVDRGEFIVECGLVKFTYNQAAIEEYREELKQDSVAGDFL